MDEEKKTRKEIDTCFEGAAFETMKKLMDEKGAEYFCAETAGKAAQREESDSSRREPAGKAMTRGGGGSERRAASGPSPFRPGVPLLVASYLLGAVSLVLWVLFLSRGALGIIDLGLGYTGALLLDASLSLIFFVQHSFMVRTSFKRWMARFVSEHYHGAVYAIASGVALLGLTLFWQAPAPARVVLHGIPRPFVYALSVVAVAGFIWGVRALGAFDMLGSAPILRSLRNEPPPEPMPLTIRGPYRWVRHPLYFCCLAAIWAVPELTADRLLYNIMWSGWIIVGSMLEERDLIALFGAAYRDYRKKVPMLIPWRIVPVSASSLAGGPMKERT